MASQHDPLGGKIHSFAEVINMFECQSSSLPLTCYTLSYESAPTPCVSWRACPQVQKVADANARRVEDVLQAAREASERWKALLRQHQQLEKEVRVCSCATDMSYRSNAGV